MDTSAPTYQAVINSTFMKNIVELANLQGGFFKDFVRRVLIATDEPWWQKNTSEWKISIVHPWCPENSYTPDYWEERVLDLCSYDLTRSNFGLGFNDLMDMDVATFEKIEKRVHEMAERQQATLKKEGIGGNNNNQGGF